MCPLSRLFPFLSTLLALALLAGCDGTGPSDEGGSTIFPQPEPQVQSFPRWSPDGERILYYDHGLEYDPQSERVEQNPDRRGLWTMRPDGSDRRQVLAGGSLYGDWSPGGDSLVFEAGGQIYKAAFEGGVVDTSSIVALSPSGRRCFFPDWSPKGKRVAYDNTNCGTAANPAPDSCGIFMVINEGDQRKRVGGGRFPNWSPNEDGIVYVGLREEVFRIDIGDENPTRLTSLNQENSNAADIRYPRVSPDGGEIAVQINFQVWTIDADGSEKRKLTDTEERWHAAGQPDWSPDGESIVYIGPEHTIWVMNADGSDKKQLTTRPEGPVGQGES